MYEENSEDKKNKVKFWYSGDMFQTIFLIFRMLPMVEMRKQQPTFREKISR